MTEKVALLYKRYNQQENFLSSHVYDVPGPLCEGCFLIKSLLLLIVSVGRQSDRLRKSPGWGKEMPIKGFFGPVRCDFRAQEELGLPREGPLLSAPCQLPVWG